MSFEEDGIDTSASKLAQCFIRAVNTKRQQVAI